MNRIFLIFGGFIILLLKSLLFFLTRIRLPLKLIIQRIFTSCHMTHSVSQADIGPITISDHAPVTIFIRLIYSPKTSDFWKLKPYYLMDDQFVEYLKDKTD